MTTSDRRPPARASAWIWNGALAVLMVLTSLAVASVSAWLVLPYVALMASILFMPMGVRERGRDVALAREASGSLSGQRHEQGRGEELADDRAGALVDDGDVERTSDSASIETEIEAGAGPGSDLGEGLASGADSESRAVKTKRGKGRGRKAKAVDDTPGASATWIKIGPGKFVRAESPGPPAVAGPSSSFPFPDPAPEGEATEARAIPAPDEAPECVEPVPEDGEGNLDRANGPESDTSGSPEAVDAALASPQDAPPYVVDPAEFFASLSGIGEGPADVGPSGDATEPFEEQDREREQQQEEGEVATPGEVAADEPASTPAGGNPEQAWELDLAAGPSGVGIPGVIAADEPASTPLGGNPEPAWELDLAAGPSGVDVAGSGLGVETPLPAVLDVDYGPVAGEAEMARDAGDQALADVAEAWAAEADSAEGPGMGAYLEDDPGAVAEMSRDNGIAPDAFDVDLPAVEIAIEDATPPDVGEDAAATDIPPERPNRPTVGRLLASFRGRLPWLRGIPATRGQSGPAATSGRRASRTESRRSTRVSPGLRRPTRGATLRSRQACRHFPPRSPPAPSRRA